MQRKLVISQSSCDT